MALPINHAALARLTEDGQFDDEFGESGRVMTLFQADSDSSVAGIVADVDDRPLIAGTVRIPGQGLRLVVARFTTSGALDSTFGGGQVLLDVPGVEHASASAVVLDSDGNIVAAGTATQGGRRRFVSARLRPDGSLDRSFGDQGLVLIDFDALADAPGLVSDASASSLAIDSQGRIVIGGTAVFRAVGSDPPFEIYGSLAAARLHCDGTLDLSFNGDGKALTSFSRNPGVIPSQAAARALVIDSGDRILLGGDDLDRRLCALAARLADGGLDPAFGADGFAGAGKLLFDFHRNGFGAAFAQTLAMAIDGGGRIVAGGWARFGTIAQPRTVSAMARFLHDGRLDVGFGQEGEVLTDFPPHLIGTESINALRIDRNGRILTAGYSRGTGENHQIALARYRDDGQPDPDFNGTGQVLANFEEIHRFLGEAIGLAMDGQGRIVVVGHAYLP